jgi:hypothetical protein
LLKKFGNETEEDGESEESGVSGEVEDETEEDGESE